MKALWIGLLLAAVAATAFLPSAAVGQAVVPPGNSGVNQYQETLPGPGGNELPAKKQRSPKQVLGTRNAQRLEHLGPAGRAAATLAAATAPERGSGGGRGGGAVSADQPSGSSGLGEVSEPGDRLDVLGQDGAVLAAGHRRDAHWSRRLRGSPSPRHPLLTAARRKLRWALLALSVVLLLAPATAGALTFTSGFNDPVFSSPDPLVRDHWLSEATGAGARIVRFGVPWSSVAPTQPPTGSIASEPGWPGYNWRRLDGAVTSAAAHGMQIMFTINEAPRWAEGADRPASARAGTWKPDPVAFGEFAKAVARRYSGSFPDPAVPGANLPRVSLFEAWNEPNQDYFLAPQWQGQQLFAAGWYRNMLNRFYAGVKSAQPNAKVIAPATSPYGDRPGGSRTPPVLFVRSLFCLNVGHLENLGCPARAHLDIFSDHPINLEAGPTVHARSPLDASTPDVGRLSGILRQASAAGRVLPSGKRPIWATELWWDTNPPNPAFGFPPALQARWIELADYVLWKQGVSVVINLPMVDLPVNPPEYTALQSGIFFIDGMRKPSYTAFRFPFVTRRLGKRTILAWGIARARGSVRIQRKGQGRWMTVARIGAQPQRPFQAKLEPPSGGWFRAVSRQGASLPWHQN